MSDKIPPANNKSAETNEYIRNRMQGERLDIEAIRNRLVSVVMYGHMGCRK